MSSTLAFLRGARMFERRTLAACISLATPLLAHAQLNTDRYFDDRWYITPFGSYIWADSSRRSDDGWGGGLAVGKPINPSWNVELRGMYEELDAKSNGPGKYENWSVSLEGQWLFMGRQGFNMWQAGSVQPYLVGGIGSINDKVRGDDKWSFMANAGAGIVWPIASWGRIVLDGRYRWSENRGNFGTGSDFSDWLVNI